MMKRTTNYHNNRRIERMINISLILLVLVIALGTGAMVIKGMR